MHLLCACDKGVNRSVHFASQLKWWGNDTIAIGLDNTSQETLKMLYKWADKIIITELSQRLKINGEYQEKIIEFEVGQDIYPRPFNPQLLAKVKDILETNKSWLKNG